MATPPPAAATDAEPALASVPSAARWAKVIDHTRCIGCHACTTACKSENEVPLGVNRTYVKYVDVGVFPEARRAFQVTRCNQCAHAPCVTACPTSAMYSRPDGIVDFDKSICIGCKACIAACPYDAIFINPADHSAEKCNFCAHRLDVGLEPACVVVCPTEAILVGDLDDPTSRVAQMVAREPVAVRRPEKATHPKLFYVGAHQATLDPLAAARPAGDLFLWSEQSCGSHQVVSGHPGGGVSSAAALLSYDVPHSIPWDWRVSLYTVTKGIAAGAYMVALLLVGLGVVERANALWTLAAPAVALFFLAVTGALLISDLEHPARCYLIFTRPQWRSWLVKGAFVIAGYALALLAHGLAGWVGATGALRSISWVAAPLAVLTAIYTAYLFAQAKARDLWQSPLLPPQLVVQALVAGAAALLPVAVALAPAAVPMLLRVLGFSALAHLLLVGGETTLPHVTAHARLASREMIRGRYRHYFWTGIVLMWVAALAPLAESVPGTIPALATAAILGLCAHEHAYVQGGQSVPLA